MPLDVNTWRGSPAVKAMHPTARSGYLDLLLAQWQTDDCSISSDPIDLAELSGLGDELWAQYGARILRKFAPIQGGRLRNAVCFKKWEEAKRVFEARQKGANRTNTGRTPDAERPPSARPADTRTTVVPVDVNVTVDVTENGNGKHEIDPAMLARGLGETLGLSIGYGPGSLNTALTEVAETELHAGRDLRD